MQRTDLLDDEGENRALRTFLMQYGLPGLTVGSMRRHMERSGWAQECWPVFARPGAYDKDHLTKAGAQLWIRHLLDLERAPSPSPASTDERAAQVDELLGKYWEIAYSEGVTGESRGSEAQEVLSKLRAALSSRPAGEVAKLLDGYQGSTMVSVFPIPHITIRYATTAHAEAAHAVLGRIVDAAVAAQKDRP